MCISYCVHFISIKEQDDVNPLSGNSLKYFEIQKINHRRLLKKKTGLYYCEDVFFMFLQKNKGQWSNHIFILKPTENDHDMEMTVNVNLPHKGVKLYSSEHLGACLTWAESVLNLSTFFNLSLTVARGRDCWFDLNRLTKSTDELCGRSPALH